jgi:hypothetical protein
MAGAYAAFFLAMIQHHLDRFDIARESLTEAIKLADAALNDETKPPAWNRKLTLQLLRKEAESLIGDETDSRNSSSN